MSFLRGVSVTVGGLLLALLLAELMLRAVGVGAAPAISPFGPGAEGEAAVVADAELGYRLKPGISLLDTYRINHLGYRGPEVRAARRPGTLRLLALGDSTTFGLGVGESQRWSETIHGRICL